MLFNDESIHKFFRQYNIELLNQCAARTSDFPRDHELDFASNDYLGLASCPSWREKVWSALRTYPDEQAFLGSTGSRFISGHHAAMRELEELLAKSLGYQSALYFSTGYMANIGLASALGSISGAKVFYDQFVHASIKDGLKLGRVEAQAFRHNDLEHLRKRLKNLKSGDRCFVIVESLYSMDGDFAPLNEIMLLCEEFEAQVIVDEAHTFGWREPDFTNSPFARIVTFGKAMGSSGAAIMLGADAATWLSHKANSFIYTTAAAPLHVLPNLLTVKELYDGGFAERQKNLIANIAYFHSESAKKDFQILGDALSPIRGVAIAGNEALLKAQEKLRSKGFFIKGIRSPTVRKGAERLRISIHAQQDKEDIDGLLELLT